MTQKKNPKEVAYKALVNKVLEQSVVSLEQEYTNVRKQEMESLHNKLIDIITKESASPQNTLLVLDIIRQEVLEECMEKFFGKASVPPHTHASEKENAVKAPKSS